MKKVLLLILALLIAVPALANGRGGHGHGHFGGVRAPSYFVGGTIIGGVIVSTWPRYYPAPVYYPAPAPIYPAPVYYPSTLFYCDATRLYYYPGAMCPIPWREVQQ